jgi:hypothetical protein
MKRDMNRKNYFLNRDRYVRRHNAFRGDRLRGGGFRGMHLRYGPSYWRAPFYRYGYGSQWWRRYLWFRDFFVPWHRRWYPVYWSPIYIQDYDLSDDDYDVVTLGGRRLNIVNPHLTLSDRLPDPGPITVDLNPIKFQSNIVLTRKQRRLVDMKMREIDRELALIRNSPNIRRYIGQYQVVPDIDQGRYVWVKVEPESTMTMSSQQNFECNTCGGKKKMSNNKQEKMSNEDSKSDTEYSESDKSDKSDYSDSGNDSNDTIDDNYSSDDDDQY